MAASTTVTPSGPTGLPGLGGSWEVERSRLRRDFHRFDVLFFLICTLVGLDTIGSVAAHGPEGLTWMVVLAVPFVAYLRRRDERLGLKAA